MSQRLNLITTFFSKTHKLCSPHRYKFIPRIHVANASQILEISEKPKPFQSIPGPSGLPYLGTLFSYTRGPYTVSQYHNALLENYNRFGKIFKENIAGHSVVHLFDPELIKEVYAHEGKIPRIPPLLETTQLYRKYRNMSLGLGNTNGEEWYRLRTNINQMMMRPQAVTQFLPHVNAVINDFLARLEKQRGLKSHQVPNFENEVSRWILESSAMTCFEKRLGCFEAKSDSLYQKMIDANSVIFALSLQLRFSIPWYKVMPQFSKTWRQLVAAEDFFFGNGQKLVDETVEKVKKLQEEGKLLPGNYAFITYLLGKMDLSYKDISIIALSLFADGLSTTVPSTVGQLYCLAANQEAQEKLRQEIKKIAPDPDADISPEVLNKASYLKACIKEGFRFFPIGTEVSRIPEKDMVLGGYHIPAGTHLQLNNNLLLRLEEYFDSPDEYMPERWIRGQAEATTHPYLLLPFGFGPRTCAGRRFAEQEMQVFIIKLLQKYRLEWPHSYRMTQRYNMLLKPDGPADFRLIPISQRS